MLLLDCYYFYNYVYWYEQIEMHPETISFITFISLTL
jgi:hypothetical protein